MMRNQKWEVSELNGRVLAGLVWLFVVLVR